MAAQDRRRDHVTRDRDIRTSDAASASVNIASASPRSAEPIGNIMTWIDMICTRYAISEVGAQKRAIILFFASCARILVDELTPQVARRCIRDCCIANGCARIRARDVAEAYDIISRGATTVRGAGTICARVHARSLRCIEAILARILPVKYSRAGNKVAEFAQQGHSLPARIFNSVDSETRDDIIILPIVAVSARDIDTIRADVIIYNALGMAPIARILDNQFVRACSKKEGTTIIVISDFDIDARVWSNVDKIDNRDGMERVSIICHSERKLSALFDIIVT